MKVTSGENVNYDDYARAWTKFDPDTTWWIEGDQLPFFLENVGRPLGFPKDLGSSDRLKFISDLNVPAHNGRHHFSEVLYCLARRLGGVSLPESSLTAEIESQMRQQFPVYQKDPSTIITAVQRLSVYKFITRLRGHIILRKLADSERTGEPFKPLVTLGVAQEEAFAGAIILRYTRKMVALSDSIVSEPMADFRAVLFDPESKPGEYEALLEERQQKRQLEIVRIREAGGSPPCKGVCVRACVCVYMVSVFM